MARVQLLNHTQPAVAAQILDVLRPAAAQEAGWLGLPPGDDAADTAAPQRLEADDLADITASRHVHLGARLSPAQALRLGVADPRRLAGVLSLAPDRVHEEASARLCIALLVVAPWAQRQGLARALVQAALQRGRGWGFSVTAACANTAALALYQGQGFVPGRRGLLGAARVPVVQLLREAEPMAEPMAEPAAEPAAERTVETGALAPIDRQPAAPPACP